jgi:hypothetical protein
MATRTPLTPRQTILYGTLVVGSLDALDAIVMSLLKGSTPARMFRGIASGLLGREALTGGLPAAVLGMLLHFFIAFSVVTTFYLASRRLSVLARHPLVCGPIYGVLVYLFMYRLVIPLSAIGITPRFALPWSINDVLIHALGVGLGSAWFASRSAGVETLRPFEMQSRAPSERSVTS